MLAAVVGPQGDVPWRPVRALDRAGLASRGRARPRAARSRRSASAGGDEEAMAATLPDSPVPIGPTDADDAAVTARVRAAFVELGHSVQVLTRAGVVTLSGVVDTELEKSQALRIARATQGVARVEDRLIVLAT